MNGTPKKVDPIAWERRLARIERWRRPLITPWDRIRAWANAMAIDHAFARMFYLNKHRVGTRAWRSAQPLPHQLRAFARQGGKSVVSLRGGQTFGSLPLEIETCREAGLVFENFVLRSRSLPSRKDLLKLATLFETLAYPVLFHCKSGADRAGFVSALYLALAEGAPVAEARRQLGLRYGHIRQSKTGVLDAFFDAYERETGGSVPLRKWIETGYDPAKITREFRSESWASWLVDKVLARE